MNEPCASVSHAACIAFVPGDTWILIRASGSRSRTPRRTCFENSRILAWSVGAAFDFHGIVVTSSDGQRAARVSIVVVRTSACVGSTSGCR